MPEVVGVRFRSAGPVYYFDPKGIDFQVGDWAIVETPRGKMAGRVVITPRQVLESQLKEELKPVLRKAGPEDAARLEELKRKEREALHKCAELVTKHNLQMKLLAAEYNFEGTHLVIYFSAEGRVDFRALLRELGSCLKTRVELRQVGARDAARLLGGLGMCGRPICCLTHLSTLESISVKMARDQDLLLDPAKISGICGRLLCCLAFEHEQYLEARRKLPSPGEEVVTAQGGGKVVKVNPLRETVAVQLSNETTLELPASEVTPKSQTQADRSEPPPSAEG